MADKDTILTEPDTFGRHWVYVTATEAFAHPRGRPGPAEYAIALWFAGVGAFEAALNISFGAFGIVPAVFTVLLLGCAVGLILRMPWAFVAAILLAVREMFGFIQLIGGGAFEVPPLLAAYGVTNAVIGTGIIFYLVEGDRPNLIYRHRYRSYRTEAKLREVEDAHDP
ncbi:MAG: hypothetical protein AAF576_06075 [Pseudomonadota bacterium]